VSRRYRSSDCESSRFFASRAWADRIWTSANRRRVRSSAIRSVTSRMMAKTAVWPSKSTVEVVISTGIVPPDLVRYAASEASWPSLMARSSRSRKPRTGPASSIRPTSIPISSSSP